MNTCPHGYVHPPSVAYGLPPPKDDGARTRAIRDSRECPDCLRAEIEDANNLLNRIFIHRIFDAETYTLWVKYVRKYNP